MAENDLIERDAGVALPPSLQVERHGVVAVLRLTRAAKRNALDDATVLGPTHPGWDPTTDGDLQAMVFDTEARQRRYPHIGILRAAGQKAPEVLDVVQT